MIKVENTEVFGWEAAIRGMRNPLDSWAKSDSYRDNVTGEFQVGEADLSLMKRLVKAGSDHSKFMRMINVTVDVTAPMYWWKEADTYKVGTVRNSCSTMHRIHAKEFTLDDFSHEHLIGDSVEVLGNIIDVLNEVRDAYIDYDNIKDNLCDEITNKKDLWWQLIQLLPSSYNQRATLQLNYAVLRNIYHSRKNHKLDCWKSFCDWIESLPYARELITI